MLLHLRKKKPIKLSDCGINQSVILNETKMQMQIQQAKATVRDGSLSFNRVEIVVAVSDEIRDQVVHCKWQFVQFVQCAQTNKDTFRGEFE